MCSVPSPTALPVDTPTNQRANQSTIHRKNAEKTPSKRKVSALDPHFLSDTKAQSAPNIFQEDQEASSLLQTPDRPIFRKRAKSESVPIPTTAVSGTRDATVTPTSGTPGSCNRKEDYQRDTWRNNHVRKCPDPICRHRRTPDGHDTQSPKANCIQAADPFRTEPQNDQGEPPGLFATSNADRSREHNSTKESGSDAGRKGSQTARELHGESPVSEKAADQETGIPSEASFDQTTSTSNKKEGVRRSEGAWDMHGSLRAKLKERLTSGEQDGIIYVIKDLDKPRLCKIGRAKDTKDRLKSLEYSCGLKIKHLYDRPVSLYSRTEGLIHAYLSEFCRPYKCIRCGQKHGEWFEISDELAVDTVDKWVDFITRESPYDSDPQGLKPFWSLRLKSYGFGPAELDFNKMRKRWDKFISPSKLEHFRFKVRFGWEVVWKFFWPVYATVAWSAAFIAFQHPFTFFLMVTSVIGTFVSITTAHSQLQGQKHCQR